MAASKIDFLIGRGEKSKLRKRFQNNKKKKKENQKKEKSGMESEGKKSQILPLMRGMEIGLNTFSLFFNLKNLEERSKEKKNGGLKI